MQTRGYPLKTSTGLIEVNQIEGKKYNLSFNPDDNRFHIAIGLDTIQTYKDWRNAVYQFRKLEKAVEP